MIRARKHVARVRLQFVQAVERGDIELMRRYVELVKNHQSPVKGFNINCVDPLGRLVALIFFRHRPPFTLNSSRQVK